MTDTTHHDALDARLHNVLCNVIEEARGTEKPMKDHERMSFVNVYVGRAYIKYMNSGLSVRNSARRELTHIAALCVRMLADMEEGKGD